MSGFIRNQICDFLDCINAHYGFWFNEVSIHLGSEIAAKLEKNVKIKTLQLASSRLSKIFKYNHETDLLNQLEGLSDQKLEEIQTAIALNWLAFDGIWFQEVENNFSMVDAKICNDNAWRSFSPFEAESIKKRISLSENSGLSGLKMALGFRLYSFINKQSIGNETSKSFCFYMNECRVQLARKRKGLDDYPCKSAGIIEYTSFAKTIDKSIETQIIACPPDAHPEEWFCGWKFLIP